MQVRACTASETPHTGTEDQFEEEHTDEECGKWSKLLEKPIALHTKPQRPMQVRADKSENAMIKFTWDDVC